MEAIVEPRISLYNPVHLLLWQTRFKSLIIIATLNIDIVHPHSPHIVQHYYGPTLL